MLKEKQSINRGDISYFIKQIENTFLVYDLLEECFLLSHL